MNSAAKRVAHGECAEPGDWLARGLAVAIVLSVAVAMSPNGVDSDLWGHVLYGQDVLRDGRLPDTATYTYTAAGHRWINHETLAELSLAAGFQYLGVRPMLVIKCLAGMLLIGLMLRTAKRRGVQTMVVSAVLMLVAVCLTAFWSMRPQVFSFVFLGLLIVILDRAFDAWRSRGELRVAWLWLAPPLFAFWANSHGAFVAGLCLFAAYLVGRSVEALLRDGRRAWLTVGQLVLVAVFTVSATLINPYGPDLWTWLIESLSQPRPENSEWRAPLASDDFFVPFVLLVGMTAAAWFGTRKPRDWVHFLLIMLCLWQSLLHLRHIALLAITVGFWVPEHVESLIDRLRRVKSESVPSAMASWQRILVMSGMVLVTGLLGYRLATQFREIPVRRDDYPVDALQFMADRGLGGKMVVSFSWAQYAIAALRPNISVAFDGRFRTCYPQEVVDLHFDFQLGPAGGGRNRSPASGPLDPKRVLEFGKPDLVLVDRRCPHGARVVEAHSGFVLLYQDGIAQLWGRRDRFDARQSPQYLPPAQRSITDARPTGSIAWPALPRRAVSAQPRLVLAGQADT